MTYSELVVIWSVHHSDNVFEEDAFGLPRDKVIPTPPPPPRRRRRRRRLPLLMRSRGPLRAACRSCGAKPSC